MGYKLSLKSGLPSTAEWLLIIGFIASALVLATQTLVLTTVQSSYILLAVGVLTLLAKIITNQPAA